MRNTVKSLVAAAALAAFTNGYAQSATDVQKALLDVSTQTWVAFEHSDWKTMQTLTTPEFVLVGAPGVLNGQQLAKLAQSCKLSKFSLSDPQIRVLNAKSAVLIYTAHQDFTCDGHPQPSTMFVADSFTKAKGKWLVVAHVETASDSSGSTPQ